MEYTLIKSNRKTIAIIIRDGAVIVRAPLLADSQSIKAFVAEKEAWINERLQEYRPVGIQSDLNYAYVFGEYKEIIYINNPKWSLVIDEKIVVYSPETSSMKAKVSYIENQLKIKLIKIIDEAIDSYSQALGLERPPYKVRKYKRIHGRCSSNDELAFNTYLYEHTIDFIHYVVLHECAHLIEFNHSKSFYALIEASMSNYKDVIAQDKKQLKTHLDQ
ncbi:M48 family metallopeptidase [Erysipelothrix urinaevulpis]|uniref:M48 family metallopeptidase n=1 Tax=Erysipelothrix urinaevulpis TaxID=2683717 RepID=UPI00135B89B7|nr:YgjP-like metallopeptidase domain-containing protein [Erysipelothrix urinaevulpis]